MKGGEVEEEEERRGKREEGREKERDICIYLSKVSIIKFLYEFIHSSIPLASQPSIQYYDRQTD